jgi:hypothetical protein
MEPERSQESNANPEAWEEKHDRQTVAIYLAMTSLGFLVLEGIVCRFSHRADPWHGYLWFASATLLCVAAVLLLSFRCHKGSTTRNAVLGVLAAVGVVHAFMTLLYAATLVPAIALRELMFRLILPVVIDCILAIRLFALDGESARVVSEARNGTNPFLRSPSSNAWYSMSASLSFGMLIVLACVWSCSSSFSFYRAQQLATFDFSRLKPSPELLRHIGMQSLFSCVHETIIRLFPLTIAHGSMLLVSRIRVTFLRITALACVFSAAAWGYVLVLMNTSTRDSWWIATYATWFIPLIIPFAYPLLLSYRALRRLSD